MVTENLFDALSQLGLENLEQRFRGYGLYHDTNRWFVRSWIVQEVANAREIRVLCGNTEIRWRNIVWMSRLQKITGWVYQCRLNTQLEYTYREKETASMEVYRWQDLRNTCKLAKTSMIPEEDSQMLDGIYGSKSEWGRGFTWFLHIMLDLRLTECHDPRDKVYAALSIAGPLFLTNIRELIVPDYKSPVDQIFTNVTGMVIQNSASINCLPCAQSDRSKRYIGLPTWVPDYSRPASMSTMMSFRGFRHFDASLSRGSKEFQYSIEGKF